MNRARIELDMEVWNSFDTEPWSREEHEAARRVRHSTALVLNSARLVSQDEDCLSRTRLTLESSLAQSAQGNG